MATFHAYICMFQWIASWALFIWGLTPSYPFKYSWAAGLAGWLLFAPLNELLLSIKFALCKGRVQSKNYAESKGLDKCVPIVYSPTYNIHAFGLEKVHPFDASKYRRIFEQLKETKVITSAMKIHQPEVPDREFLQEVMTWQYLFSLNYATKIAKIIEIPVCILPSWVLRMRVLEPMACASLGSVEAACIAKLKGWAVNLGGGFHHALRSEGSGFCIYPDITMVSHYMEKWYGLKKIMIIDLDAH